MWTLLPAMAACVHRVELTSSPPGAAVYQDDARVGTTPVALDVGSRDVRVELAGYRTIEMRLPATTGAWGFVAEAVTFRWRRARGRVLHSRHELLLVEEHGGVGTWSLEEPR